MGDSSPETRSLTHPREPPTSSPRSSCWTTPVKSETVTLQSWIATPPILPANSPRSRRNAIVVPAKLPKRTPSSSNLVMLPWLPWFPPSPCASNPSLTSPHWVVSLSVTCVKPSLSESSSPSTSRMPPLERSPRPQKRPERRSELRTRKQLRSTIHQKALIMFNLTIFVKQFAFLWATQNLVRILLPDWIILHRFH